MKLIVKTIFGSKLYGTDSPTSDEDYKGIYLPTLSDCVLGNFARNINTNSKKDTSIKNVVGDVDMEIFSLQEFVRLALEGQTVAMDMLHTGPTSTQLDSPIWQELRNNRHRFYTKKMSSFIGYARTMAQKYAARADRLDAAIQVRSVLDEYNSANWPQDCEEPNKLKDIWDLLPNIPHTMKYEYDQNTNVDNKWVYDVCGRKLPINITVQYALEIVDNLINEYGKRVRAAQSGEGIDFKSISHAFRVGYELKEILTTGDLVFPLKDAPFLKGVKYGQFHFANDHLGEKLENLIDEVTDLCEKSSLPEKPDRKWAEQFILDSYFKR